MFMGVQFTGRGKIKSYNHNGRCVLLDETCFKRGIDCTPCTRIHKPKPKPKLNTEQVVVTHKTILQSETKPVFESISETIPESDPMFELVPDKTPDIVPKSIVEPELKPTPEEVHIETPDKTITDEPILICKKKGIWSKFKDFIGSIKSIFKRNNRKPPKTPLDSTGNIYV
jgi:hypothetical protein